MIKKNIIQMLTSRLDRSLCHPYIVPNHFLSFGSYFEKKKIVQIVEKVNDVLQNILFCVLQKKEKHAGVQWHAF